MQLHLKAGRDAAIPARELALSVRHLAWPAIASSLLQTLVFVVDRAMLGQYSETSLAAMQVAGPIEWSVWSVFAAFEVGAIARVGQHVGAGDRVGARRAAWMSLGVAVLTGGALALAAPVLLSLLPWSAKGASVAVLSEARGYLGVTLGASPAVFATMAAIAVLQGSGDTRTPLVVGVVANLLHVAANRILILGAFGLPALGARGAAYSSAGTFVLQAILLLAVLGMPGRRVSLRGALLDEGRPWEGALSEARPLLAIGGTALGERVIYHLGYLGFATMISRLGDRSMAANQALISVEAICFLSADGFGVAAASLVAQRLGAGKPEEAEQASRLSVKYAVVLLTSLGLIFLVARRLILPGFSRDEAVVELGVATMPLLAVAQPFMAVAVVRGQALRGAGATRRALAVSAVGAFFVRLSATWFFALHLHMGLIGVWLGSTCDWIVRTALYAVVGKGAIRGPTPRPVTERRAWRAPS